MRDSYGREINYARISITDQCNLRCVYCMPAAACMGAEVLRPQKRQASQDTYLSAAEILRIGTVFADLGIHDLRVTGGEPLVRSDAVDIVRSLKNIPGIRRVALTTNGQLLGDMAASLKAAGLDGINVSLDTLDAAAYRDITRGGDFALTLAGIDAALAAGFSPVKVNCVLLDRDRRNDALGIAALARDRDIRVRFIEMMPIGMGVNFAGVSGGEVRSILEEAYGPWEPAGVPDGSGGEPRLKLSVGKQASAIGSGPARYGRFRGFREAIGFISPLSDRFCGTCNRIRLSSTGFLRSCLHGEAGVNLRPALEQQDDAQLRHDIVSVVNSKAAGHRFSITADGQEQAEQAGPGAAPAFMSQIGG
ncbi:cyclic pyranopterin monophosphate synthase [Spirochaetia bacterium]|nr:cyclic pyranopterin monophosphate synthase [Spirochaetia bacterium]